MNAGTLDERKAVARVRSRVNREPRLEAMPALAASEPGMAVTPDELHANPWLFNCMNGTIDLRTGELRQHRREDMITQLCPGPTSPRRPLPSGKHAAVIPA